MRCALGSLLSVACLGPAVAADPPAPIDASRMHVELDRIWMSRLLWYEHGDPAAVSSAERMEVLLTLHHDGIRLVSAAPAPVCSSALSDTGEQLAPSEEEQRRLQRLVGDPYRGFRFASATKHTLPLQFTLRRPSAAAKRLATLEGSMVVTVETAAGETIALAPLADWVGKTREVPGCPEGVTVITLSPLTIAIDEGVLSPEHVVSLTLLDAKGKELLAGRTATTLGHRTTLVYASLDFPPDGSVQMRLPGPTTTVTVPIALHDIPLEGPPRPAEKGALPPRSAKSGSDGGF